MAHKNIQMKKRAGAQWDNLYPITLDSNVFDTSGVPVSQKLANIDQKHQQFTTQLNQNTNQIQQVTTQLNQNTNQINNLRSDLNDVQKKVPDRFGTIALQPHPLAKNPVLTKHDVTDLQAKFVADPFFAYEDGIYHMFFEVADNDDVGSIGHATSVDGLEWKYNKIILTGGGHWAYPYVFKYNGDWYMLPDRGGSVTGLTLYRAKNFPEVWEPDTRLFTSGYHLDPTAFEWNGKWYLMDYSNNRVNLYYADSIKSTNWTTHPSSPILTGSQVRPGGRPIVAENHIDIFIQDGSSGVYGEKLFMYRISELTPTSLKMKKVKEPIIQAANNGLWNSRAMHHLDLQFTNKGSLPIAVVDGRAPDWSWGIGIYTIGAEKPKPLYRALLSANQSIPSATWTKVNLTNIQIDTTKSSDGTGGYIVPESGYYSVSVSVSAIFQNKPNPHFLINTRILVNGTEVRSNPVLGISTTGSLRQSYRLNDIIVLEEGDKVEVEFYHASGSATDIITTGGATFISLVKVD